MLTVDADTWVRKLRDTDSLYTEVCPEDLFAKLQAGCTGRNALNLLLLHNEMQRYHLEVKGIPKYINMFEDAQRQGDRAGRKNRGRDATTLREYSDVNNQALPLSEQ